MRPAQGDGTGGAKHQLELLVALAQNRYHHAPPGTRRSKPHAAHYGFSRLGGKNAERTLSSRSDKANTKPWLGLEPGDVGVVVHVYGQGAAYEVEFLTLDRHTVSVETVGAADLRQAHGDAVVHERERLAA